MQVPFTIKLAITPFIAADVTCHATSLIPL